jgi:hypothetical protein
MNGNTQTTSLLNNLNLSRAHSNPNQSNCSPPQHSLTTTAIKNAMFKSNGSNSEPVPIKTEPLDHHQFLQQQHQMLQQRLGHLDVDKIGPIIRNPVGANPRDVNNPLSVNQLTKRDYASHNTAAYLALNINHALAAAAVAAQQQQQPPPPTITGPGKQPPPQQLAPQDISLLGHPNAPGFHNFHNLHAPLHYQLAAAAAAANQAPSQAGKPNPNHRPVDDGNAISVT